MPNPNDLYQDEKNLRALQNLLQSHERKLAIQSARWDDMLSKVPEWKRLGLEETIEKQKARGNHEISVLQQRIANLQKHIAEQYEEVRQRASARAWLEPIKEQARESWLSSGGTEAGFTTSWPEMERQILIQGTLESLDVQPETMRKESATKQPGTKRNWNSKWDKNLKPPPDTNKKKAH